VRMRLVPVLLAVATVPAAVASGEGGVISFTGGDGLRRVVNVASLAPAPGSGVPRGAASLREGLWPTVERVCRERGLDPGLVDLVIRMESGYNPRAVSPKGAMGVMQLMPGTAAMYGVRDAFDAAENIRAGVSYLADLMNRFGSDVGLALAAYNAGPEAVARHGGIPPYRETRNYVASILNAYQGDVRPVLSGGFGRPAVPQRTVRVTQSSGATLISNLPPADPAVDRRLALR
jgi:hypothetical protein